MKTPTVPAAEDPAPIHLSFAPRCFRRAEGRIRLWGKFQMPKSQKCVSLFCPQKRKAPNVHSDRAVCLSPDAEARSSSKKSLFLVHRCLVTDPSAEMLTSTICSNILGKRRSKALRQNHLWLHRLLKSCEIVSCQHCLQSQLFPRHISS